jgi:hypothetical protein
VRQERFHPGSIGSIEKNAIELLHYLRSNSGGAMMLKQALLRGRVKQVFPRHIAYLLQRKKPLVRRLEACRAKIGFRIEEIHLLCSFERVDNEVGQGGRERFVSALK